MIGIYSAHKDAGKKPMKKLAETYPFIPYVAPFGVFVLLLGLKNQTPWNAQWEYPIRSLVVSALVCVVSWRVISNRPAFPLRSAIVGLAVFAIWIGPDIIWPGYRTHRIFQNALTGAATTSLPTEALSNPVFLSFRVLGSAVLVPIIEELFWRGWLMRYLISADFEKIPLGAYSHQAFWITAMLFATEHGPYWDVGLLAGLAYGAWMLRTRNLADCMIAHGVTNACLAVYVIVFNRVEYWL